MINAWLILMSSQDEVNYDLPVHWISKNARYRIIELMLTTRSITELSRVLGVSPTAIRKYIKRQSHPSDEVMYEAIRNAGFYEKDMIISIVIDDLVEAVQRLYKSIDEKYREELRRKLSIVLGISH